MNVMVSSKPLKTCMFKSATGIWYYKRYIRDVLSIGPIEVVQGGC
jgi:hypothetical protein